MICFCQNFCSTLFSFFVPNPLGLYGFASITGLFAAVAYYFGHRAVVHPPKLGQFTIAQFFLKISSFKGIDNICTFKGFNSFYHFFGKTFFHNRYILVTAKGTKQYNGSVYNLSVWEDESYVTKMGITHNCRCYTTQTAETASNQAYPPEKALQLGVQKGFDFNAAKTGEVYNKEKHPYFAMAQVSGKTLQRNMELMKLEAPLEVAYKAKNGAVVRVSPFADPADFETNLKSMVVMADVLHISSGINAHLELKHWKNAEIHIGKITGDRVAPISKNIRSGITNAFNDKFKKGEQLREIENTFLILDLSNYDNLKNKIDGAVAQSWSKFNHYKNLKTLFLIYNKNAVKIVKGEALTFKAFSQEYRSLL